MFEYMYDDFETAPVRFIGFASESSRYDFGIVFTGKFYGKPLVVCMQTGKSSLISEEDAKDIPTIMNKFLIKDEEEAMELSLFFSNGTSPSYAGRTSI